MTRLQNALMAAGTTGDPMGVPWFDPRAHGQCGDRGAAVRFGFNAHQQGVAPRVACSR